MPISIDFTADTRAFTQGTAKVEGALESVVGSLDDVAKGGEKSGDRLEKSFKDVAKTVSQTRGEYESSARAIPQAYGHAADETGLHFNSLKKSSKESAKLIAESYDGSAQSIVSGFQIAAQNVLAQFGALGIAASGALGAGIGVALGLINGLLEEQAKQAEISKANIASLAKEMIKLGSNGQVSFGYIADGLKTLATDGKDGVGTLEDIAKKAKELGVDFKSMALANAGGIDSVYASYNELLPIIGKYEVQLRNAATEEERELAIDKLTPLYEQKDALQKLTGQYQTAQEQEQLYNESGATYLAAKQSALDSINGSYDQAVASIDSYVDAEKGTLDFATYVDAVQKKEDALVSYQTKLATMNFTPEQKKALQDMGVENAMLWVQGYEKASPAIQAKAKAQLTKAASDASAAANAELDKAFADPKDAKIVAVVDKAQAQKDIDNLVQVQRKKIILDFTDRYGAPIQ